MTHKQQTSPLRLVSRADAPEYLRKPWIETGYLVGGTSRESAYWTLFSRNNECLNAWTLLPGVVIAIYAVIYMRTTFPEDFFPAWLFAMSILPHTPFAIRLHCTIGTSSKTRNFWRMWDIGLIFTCGGLRALALGWYAFPALKPYYTFMAAVALIYVSGVVGMYRRGLENLTKPPFIRDTILTVLGFFIPVVVAAVSDGLITGYGEMQKWAVSLLIVDLIGATSYVFRWPERWFPGKFDFIGSGHQIMHVMICIECYLQMRILIHSAHLSSKSGFT